VQLHALSSRPTTEEVADHSRRFVNELLILAYRHELSLLALLEIGSRVRKRGSNGPKNGKPGVLVNDSMIGKRCGPRASIQQNTVRQNMSPARFTDAVRPVNYRPIGLLLSKNLMHNYLHTL
jgi:hypothetical protein